MTAGAEPGPRVLVAYATAGSEGQTELIAERTVEAVCARGASADLLDCEAAAPRRASPGTTPP